MQWSDWENTAKTASELNKKTVVNKYLFDANVKFAKVLIREREGLAQTQTNKGREGNTPPAFKLTFSVFSYCSES